MKEVLKIPLKATLYRHQQSACHFACERFGILPSETHSNGVALLMEMGCGKTITSIAIVGILYQYRHIRRILITAPLSILSVWEQEFARFAAFPYQLTVLKGSSTQKKEQLSKLHGNDLQIAVVNYESAWRLEKELLAFHADLVIADEAHKIKENRTSQSKAMHHLGDQVKIQAASDRYTHYQQRTGCLFPVPLSEQRDFRDKLLCFSQSLFRYVRIRQSHSGFPKVR